MEAPVSKSSDIHSFDEPPLPEIEPTLRTQLIEEVQLKAQQFLTEHLAQQPGFIVVPFDDVRRLQADLSQPGVPWTEEQLRALGKQTGADLVLTGRILDYGVVQTKYWVTGLVVHSTAGLLALGFATGWNPAVIGVYVAYELPDVAIWGGGAYVFGWAFRPVRIEVEAIQLTGCEGGIWIDQELTMTVPGKTLAAYPPEERKRKELQLELNLNRAMGEIAEHVGRDLRLQPCTEDGRPARRSGLGILTLLGLGH